MALGPSKLVWLGSALAVLLAAWKASSGSSSAHILAGVRKENRSYFFSIGDFGARACQIAFDAGQTDEAGGIGDAACSGARQIKVAQTMDRLAAGLRPDFVLSLGDNFYTRGVADLEDPQFNSSFETVYDGAGLAKVPWKISLGDHDQRGNVTALLLYTERSHRWRFPAPYYLEQLPTPSGQRHIQLIVADSIGLEGGVEASLLPGRRFAKDYSEEFAGATVGAEQWRWLEEALQVGSADPAQRPVMRIVVGHRPAISAVQRSRTASDLEVMRRLQALLRRAAAGGPPIVYLHGHDHAMQHLVEGDGSVQHVGNGVGAMRNHPIKQKPSEFRWGSDKTYGFVVHEVGEASMVMHFIDGLTGQAVNAIEFPFAANVV